MKPVKTTWDEVRVNLKKAMVTQRHKTAKEERSQAFKVILPNSKSGKEAENKTNLALKGKEREPQEDAEGYQSRTPRVRNRRSMIYIYLQGLEDQIRVIESSENTCQGSERLCAKVDDYQQ